MQIKDLFLKPIDRRINGVIKPEQNQEADKKQELEEYVVTAELKKHFQRFFANYVQSLEHPVDEMGVWISGFFGSGKSHFLKILSYILDQFRIRGDGVFGRQIGHRLLSVDFRFIEDIRKEDRKSTRLNSSHP